MTADPCPHCHTTVTHGNRLGCCSGCGRLFASTSAHDRHRRGMQCHDPAELGMVAKAAKGHPSALVWALPGTWGGRGQ